MPRYPSVPSIEELDSSALCDDDESGDADRTLELRRDTHPSVSPIALDLLPLLAGEDTTGIDTARDARWLVLSACAVGCAMVLGAIALAASSRDPIEPKITAAPVRITAVAAPSAVADTSSGIDPLDLPVAKEPRPAFSTHRSKASSKPTGTILTFRSKQPRAILVDGRNVGPAGIPVAVACGTHRVQIGPQAARTVTIPCHGSITVGQPD